MSKPQENPQKHPNEKQKQIKAKWKKKSDWVKKIPLKNPATRNKLI